MTSIKTNIGHIKEKKSDKKKDVHNQTIQNSFAEIKIFEYMNTDHIV